MMVGELSTSTAQFADNIKLHLGANQYLLSVFQQTFLSLLHLFLIEGSVPREFIQLISRFNFLFDDVWCDVW